LLFFSLLYFHSLDAEKNNAGIIFAICCCVFVTLMLYECHVEWFNDVMSHKSCPTKKF